MGRFVFACILAVIGGCIGHFGFETTLATVVGAIVGFLIPYIGPDALEAID